MKSWGDYSKRKILREGIDSEKLKATPSRKLTSRLKFKKALLLSLGQIDLNNNANKTHPLTGAIRATIIWNSPMRYSRKKRAYVNKWTNSHTRGGTHLKLASKGALLNIKKVWGTC